MNVATITFVTSNPATEYEVCQNQTVDWADFSWTDSISELTSIPNYCGVPNFDAIYLTEYSSDFKAALSITKDSNTNTGHVSYARRMCKRSVASDDPYEFNIELSYDDGWDPITSTDVVGI